MRIVAGKHRGRTIAAPEGRHIRPTSDRVREAMFNILEHRSWGTGGLSPISGARVLDAFCGTGALGLEALSRGARHVTFMDKNRAALSLCRQNVSDMDEAGAADILQGDCLNPVRPPEPCDLAFLDPPYREDQAQPALDALSSAGWLRTGCICVVETAAMESLSTPENFTLLDERKYGAAKVWFLRFGETTS